MAAFLVIRLVKLVLFLLCLPPCLASVLRCQYNGEWYDPGEIVPMAGFLGALEATCMSNGELTNWALPKENEHLAVQPSDRCFDATLPDPEQSGFFGVYYERGESWITSKDGKTYECICPVDGPDKSSYKCTEVSDDQNISEEKRISPQQQKPPPSPSNSSLKKQDFEPSPITCTYREQVYNEGDKWAQPGKVCVCQNGTKCDDLGYFLSNDVKTWKKAKKMCEKRGKTLAMAQDVYKLKAMELFLETASNERIWLGASDIANESSWKWLSGESLNDQGNTNWYQGFPSEDTKANCLATKTKFFSKTTEKHYWDDMICGFKNSYLCEDA